MTITIHDIGDVPLYDYDVEQEGDPDGVVRFKDAMRAALLTACSSRLRSTSTARSQTQLRQTLTYNACRVLPPPEVLIARAHERIEDGRLVDEGTRKFVADALEPSRSPRARGRSRWACERMRAAVRRAG